MNKSRQKELTRWLKQQSVISQRWLNISRLLGFVSGILIIAQAWFMARILQHMIMENIPREALLLPFTLLVLTFVLRAWVVWLRERVGYHAGQHIRFAIRRQVLDRLQQAGPAWIQGKPAGSWATLVLEQIDDMHDYYARYLPQMALAVSVGADCGGNLPLKLGCGAHSAGHCTVNSVVYGAGWNGGSRC